MRRLRERQRSVVVSILRREIGVMTLAAVVVCFLAVRAIETLVPTGAFARRACRSPQVVVVASEQRMRYVPGFRSTVASTVVPGCAVGVSPSVSVCASGSVGGTSIWRLWVSRPMSGDQLDPAGGHGDVLRGDRVLVERDPDDGLVLAHRVVVGAPRREHDRGREEGADEGAPGGELRRRHHL